VPHIVNFGITWSRVWLHAPPALSAVLIAQAAGRALQPLWARHRMKNIMPKPEADLSFLDCPTSSLVTLPTETCDISISERLTLEGGNL
jgi:hypothetical protein